MDTSWKISRATATALAAAANVLLVYLFMALGSTRDAPDAPSEEPIVVSLIDRPPRPPLPIAQITLKPKLAKLQISPPQPPVDFKIQVPADPTPSTTPNPPTGGSPGPRGPIEHAGGPSTLTVTHYVAPIYPFAAARRGEHGEIAMALRVSARGLVDQVKILRSTGSSLLDQAAVSAVRQWKFAPPNNGTLGEPVWGRVSLRFAPPQPLVGVPLILMPYAAVARRIDAEITTSPEGQAAAPATEESVRHLLQKLIAAVPGENGQERPTGRKSAEDSLEGELGLFGPIQSVTFMGFVPHGIDRDKSDPSAAGGLPHSEMTHWEVYDVKQDRGSTVWLVAATAKGVIERIEVAVRQ